MVVFQVKLKHGWRMIEFQNIILLRLPAQQGVWSSVGLALRGLDEWGFSHESRSKQWPFSRRMVRHSHGLPLSMMGLFLPAPVGELWTDLSLNMFPCSQWGPRCYRKPFDEMIGIRMLENPETWKQCMWDFDGPFPFWVPVLLLNSHRFYLLTEGEMRLLSGVPLTLDLDVVCEPENSY